MKLAHEPSGGAVRSLAGYYRGIDRLALALAERHVLPAIARGERPDWGEVRRAIRETFRMRAITSASAAVADRETAYAGRRFWAALGREIGVSFAPAESADALALVRGYTPARVFDARPRAIRPASPKLAAAFARENAERIGVLRDGIVPGLAESVRREFERGGDPDRLARHLNALWRENGVPSTIPVAGGTRLVSTRAHAQLIAEDQLGTLASQLSHAHYEQAGIKRAHWRTQGDDAVRPEHRALEGRIYRLATGVPGVGRPGEPVRCRCFSDPVINRDALRRGWTG